MTFFEQTFQPGMRHLRRPSDAGVGVGASTGWKGPARKRKTPSRASTVRVERLETRRLFDAALLAIADADVERSDADANVANANFGADAELRVDGLNSDTKETVVKFDISSVQSVGSATVQMSGGLRTPGSGPNYVSILGANSTTWVEGNGVQPSVLSPGYNLDNNPTGEVRWNNRPGSVGIPLDVIGIDANQVYSYDVTSYLQARKSAGDTVVSFVFRTTDGSGEAVFQSRETGGGAGPLLVVQDDTAAPSASATAENITATGHSSNVVTVIYTDNAGIDGSTIGTDDLVVNGPFGNALTVTAASYSFANPKGVVASYSVAAPGGSFGAGDNGNYSISIRPGAVTDLGGNSAAGGGSFNVNIPTDTTPPVASAFNAQSITSPGGSSYTFTVTYSDNFSINASTIGVSDLTVSRSGGPTLTVTNVTTSGTGGTVNATYTVAAPGGSWDAAENGTYTILVKAGSVADTAGNLIAATTGSFAVAIPDTDTPQVGIPPIAAVTTAGQTTTQITVNYSDNQAIDVSSIGADDLSVIQDGGGPLVVTLLSVSPATNAAGVVAVYSVAAPGGFWNNADNGSYTVTVQQGAVRDTSNNLTSIKQSQFIVDIISANPVADAAFNGGSAVSTGFVAEAIYTDDQGRTLIAGRQGDRAAGTSQAVLQRLNRDGSLDTFFGAGGQIISRLNDNEGFFAVTVDEKGRVLAAGFRAGEIEVVRYNTKNKLDKTFGQGGIALADWGSTDDTVFAMAALAGGKVLLAGASGGNMVFARMDAKGRVENSFAGGRLSLQPGGQPSAAGALATETDGSIVAAGTSGSSVVAVKLAADGTPDSAFGAGGVLTVAGLAARTDTPTQDHNVGLALDRDGAILIGSRTSGGDFGLRRLNADGSPDNSFSDDSLLTVDMGGDDDVDFVGVQGTGQIVAAGTSSVGDSTGDRKLAAVVLSDSGQLDSTFSAGGKFTTNSGIVTQSGFAGTLNLHASGAIQPDGRLVVTVADYAAAPTSSPIRRLLTPGSGSLGRFGVIGGKKASVNFTDADGTVATLSLSGGTAEALWDGSVLDVVLSGTSSRSTLTIKTKGGDKLVTLRNLSSDAGLKSIAARTTSFVGTISLGGDLAKGMFGSLSGTLAVAGQIGTLDIGGNVSGAFVLAGVDLGDDDRVGGAGSAADSYAQSRIGNVSVKGQAVSSYFGAGVNPMNGTFGDSDDAAVGGAASTIGTVFVKGGVNDATKLAAGSFAATARIPTRVIPTLDPHFVLLPPA